MRLAVFGVMVTASCDVARGQHADVNFSVVANQLTLQGGATYAAFLVGAGFPPMPGPPPTQTDAPGFLAADGTLAAGTNVILRIVQPLHYWTPALGVTNPHPIDTAFRVETFGGAGIEVTRAGIPDAPALEFATASAEGGVHQHLLFRLPDPVAPDGAYGVVMTLSSPGYADSAPFMAVFGQRITATQLSAARQEFAIDSQVIANVRADFDRDRYVNAADLIAWKAGFGTMAYALRTDGDSDQDADVDGADFLAWQRSFGVGPRLVAAGVAVPEPGAAALTIIATGTAAAWRRRRAGSALVVAQWR